MCLTYQTVIAMTRQHPIRRAELLVAIAFILHMNRERTTGLIGEIGTAPMDGQAVMEAHLALAQSHRDFEDRTAIGVKRLLQSSEVVIEEIQGVGMIGPVVALIDHRNRAHVLITIMKGNPGGQHALGGTGLPVTAIRMPADIGR